jgi:hypothetical protein
LVSNDFFCDAKKLFAFSIINQTLVAELVSVPLCYSQIMKKTAPTHSSEPPVINDTMVHLARNAMLVAGMEMGEIGDHWPVIKANIHALMQDYEQLKVEQAVQDQLREHVGKILADYELLLQSEPELRGQIGDKIKELRDLYEAMFSPLGVTPEPSHLTADAEETETQYQPWQSSAYIIQSLKGEEK